MLDRGRALKGEYGQLMKSSSGRWWSYTSKLCDRRVVNVRVSSTSAVLGFSRAAFLLFFGEPEPTTNSIVNARVNRRQVGLTHLHDHLHKIRL